MSRHGKQHNPKSSTGSLPYHDSSSFSSRPVRNVKLYEGLQVVAEQVVELALVTPRSAPPHG